MSGSGFKGSGITDPFLTPDAPTDVSVSAGISSASVSFTAPIDTGGGAITEYVASAKQSDGSSVSGTGTSSPIDITLTAGGTTEFAVQAFNTYGAGQFSGYGNSSTVYSQLSIFATGGNGNGYLGQDNLTNYSSPVQIAGNYKDYVVGQYHSLAIKTDGTLWAWGEGGSGELGQNDIIDRSSPTQIGALTNWSKVYCAAAISAAENTDGEVYVWGGNGNGQLGLNDIISKSSPVQLGLTSPSSFSFSQTNMYYITNGSLYASGSGLYGGIGDSTTISKSSPIQVGSDTDWVFISGGHNDAFGIREGGTGYAWGRNQYYTVGDGTNTDKSSPVQISGSISWSSISGGFYNVLGVSTSGGLYAWATNGYGQLGLNNTIAYSTPQAVGALTNWDKLSKTASLGQWSAAGKSDGTLWSWGTGYLGVTGHGDTVDRSSPVQIGSFTDGTSVNTGYLYLGITRGS